MNKTPIIKITTVKGYLTKDRKAVYYIKEPEMIDCGIQGKMYLYENPKRPPTKPEEFTEAVGLWYWQQIDSFTVYPKGVPTHIPNHNKKQTYARK